MKGDFSWMLNAIMLSNTLTQSSMGISTTLSKFKPYQLMQFHANLVALRWCSYESSCYSETS